MSDSMKSKIYRLIDSIEDQKVLSMVMEDVAYYASKKDIVDDLSPEQIKELDESINEADNNETISWDEFKKETDEWKKK